MAQQDFWPYSTLVQTYAEKYGISPDTVRRIIEIESGGRPAERTGSYRGLMQLSPKEFSDYGGRGSIYDPEQNIAAGVRKIADEANNFKLRYGREPTPQDIYLIHQQGPSGYAAHMGNPGGVAWQNIRPYYGSDTRAKQAIWGNLPDAVKAKLGTVENVKSSDLTGYWSDRMAGTGWQSTVGTGAGYRPTPGETPVTPMETAVKQFSWEPPKFGVPSLGGEFQFPGSTPPAETKSPLLKLFGLAE